MQRRDVQRACHHTYHTTVPMSHDGTSTSASTVLPLHSAHDALVVVEHQRSLQIVGERVFALLKNLFGEQQMSALADYVQAALMLNCNKRIVG